MMRLTRLPDHQQPAYATSIFHELPETERLAGEILTLPCFPEMHEGEIDQVIEAVNSWQ